MKDVIRIVVVDPLEESRTNLQRLLGGIASFWLSEVLSSYQEAAKRAAELAAHVTVVVLDHDANQAMDLIQKLAQASPASIVLPASRLSDSSLILKAFRAAGAREFLTLPAEAAEILDITTRLVRGQNQAQTNARMVPGSSRSRAPPGAWDARLSRSIWRAPWPPPRSTKPYCSTSISFSDRSMPAWTSTLTTPSPM